MQRRHFELIARILKEANESVSSREARAAVSNIAATFSDALKRENPRFDRARFLLACGEGESN
jgi:hypothetical protein